MPLRWWDKATYAASKAWGFDDWGWEFVRRDEDYRRDFDTLAPRHGSTRHGLDKRGDDFLSHGPGWFSAAEQENPVAAGLRYWPFRHWQSPRYRLEVFFDPRISD